jgi:hypothetical protein
MPASSALELPIAEAVHAAASGIERRIHQRLRPEEVQWLRHVRLKNGPEVSLVDISSGGALVEARVQLKPGSSVTLQMTTSGRLVEIASDVLRCGIATLDGAATYRGAFVFAQPIEIMELARAQLNGGIDRAAAAAAWQKIVVRYREGSTLKGYTVDFHPSRGHFSLWPSVDAHKSDRVMVPLARLKALFFVKTFDGNKWHVAAESPHAASAGRKIEVTFFDKEVVRGTTLGYRPDGVGFFITPLDSGSNNQRVFVVNSAVHQVKFP